MIRLEMGRPLDSRVSYDEAIMYCFCLGDGWRLPTMAEADFLTSDRDCTFIACWVIDRRCDYRRYVQPVREVKDA